MSQLIKNIMIKRAYLARLYSLCVYFAEDDISVSTINNDIIFGGMNPISSFEFCIQRPPNKSLFDFDETSTKEPDGIHFTVSKDDFSTILAPFSKSGGLKQPKKDTDLVTLEISGSKVKFIQDNLNHVSRQVNMKIGEGTLIPLPNDDWEFSISPNMVSDYILRMASSSGTTVKFKQEGTSLCIESNAGKEKVPSQASKSLESQIDVSRMTLMKVRAQLNGYEHCKIGIRDSFLMIEGHWGQGICKWKLDAINRYRCNSTSTSDIEHSNNQ